MRFLVISLILPLVTACSANVISRAPASVANAPWGLNPAELPEPQAVLRWSDPQYEDSHMPQLTGLSHVEIPASCSDKRLYPTHPQQFSKVYHVFRLAIYDQDQVPADSHVCKVHSTTAKPFCQLADTFEYAVISDIYADACGGLYRGVWNVGFLKQDDNSGTLLAKGRTVYPKKDAEFAEESEEGPTYAVDRKEFLFLVSALPGDKESAAKLASQAAPALSLNPTTHLFEKNH